jgi:hypothetical protein
MAEAQGGSGASTAVVAIVAMVLLVLMVGFFFLRGRHAGGGSSGVRGNVEFNVPKSPAPQK